MSYGSEKQRELRERNMLIVELWLKGFTKKEAARRAGARETIGFQVIKEFCNRMRRQGFTEPTRLNVLRYFLEQELPERVKREPEWLWELRGDPLREARNALTALEGQLAEAASLKPPDPCLRHWTLRGRK